ncbi:MAG: M48 family metallopeptidase [Patescibacteria group bacterium]
MTLYTQKDKNIRKTYLLIFGFLVFIIALGWYFSFVLNSGIILYIAVIFSVAMSFISYWYSDKIVLKMSGAREITKKDSPEIYRIVENLSITAGLPAPKIYIIEDIAMNAFATGRDYKHSVVAVTTGLLKVLDKNELEGVIAHELSHIGNRDTLVSTLVVVLVGFVALLSDFFIRMQIFGIGGRNKEGGGQAQIILMIIGILFAILSPIVAMIIQLSISRKREFLADASGALLTRYPEGLASALHKISKDNHKIKRVSKSTAHLFFSDPIHGLQNKKKISWFGKLFMTHPLAEERIKALLNNEK